MGIPSLRLALLALVASTAVAGEAVERTEAVTTTGESLHSFEAAKEEALRKAVEQAGGKIIHAASHVHNFRLKHHTIMSRSAGYVRRFDILKQWRDGETCLVKLRAEVDTGRIDADWGALQILLERKGRPVVLVAIDEQVADLPGPGPAAEHALVDLLDKMGLALVDEEALQQAGGRDRVRAEAAGDTRRAATIAAQLHASYVVLGTATVNAGAPRKVYDIESRPVEVGLLLRVVSAGSGRVLASKVASRARMAVHPVTAARLSLAEAARDAGGQALARLLEHWSRDLDAGAPVTLHGSRVDSQVLDAIIASLFSQDELAAVS